jgi:hypothetical protein
MPVYREYNLKNQIPDDGIQGGQHYGGLCKPLSLVPSLISRALNPTRCIKKVNPRFELFYFRLEFHRQVLDAPFVKKAEKLIKEIGLVETIYFFNISAVRHISGNADLILSDNMIDQSLGNILRGIRHQMTNIQFRFHTRTLNEGLSSR